MADQNRRVYVYGEGTGRGTEARVFVQSLVNERNERFVMAPRRSGARAAIVGEIIDIVGESNFIKRLPDGADTNVSRSEIRKHLQTMFSDRRGNATANQSPAPHQEPPPAFQNQLYFSRHQEAPVAPPARLFQQQDDHSLLGQQNSASIMPQNGIQPLQVLEPSHPQGFAEFQYQNSSSDSTIGEQGSRKRRIEEGVDAEVSPQEAAAFFCSAFDSSLPALGSTSFDSSITESQSSSSNARNREAFSRDSSQSQSGRLSMVRPRKVPTPGQDPAHNNSVTPSMAQVRNGQAPMQPLPGRASGMTHQAPTELEDYKVPPSVLQPQVQLGVPLQVPAAPFQHQRRGTPTSTNPQAPIPHQSPPLVDHLPWPLPLRNCRVDSVRLQETCDNSRRELPNSISAILRCTCLNPRCGKIFSICQYDSFIVCPKCVPEDEDDSMNKTLDDSDLTRRDHSSRSWSWGGQYKPPRSQNRSNSQRDQRQRTNASSSSSTKHNLALPTGLAISHRRRCFESFGDLEATKNTVSVCHSTGHIEHGVSPLLPDVVAEVIDVQPSRGSRISNEMGKHSIHKSESTPNLNKKDQTGYSIVQLSSPRSTNVTPLLDARLTNHHQANEKYYQPTRNYEVFSSGSISSLATSSFFGSCTQTSSKETNSVKRRLSKMCLSESRSRDDTTKKFKINDVHTKKGDVSTAAWGKSPTEGNDTNCGVYNDTHQKSQHHGKMDVSVEPTTTPYSDTVMVSVLASPVVPNDEEAKRGERTGLASGDVNGGTAPNERQQTASDLKVQDEKVAVVNNDPIVLSGESNDKSHLSKGSDSVGGSKGSASTGSFLTVVRTTFTLDTPSRASMEGTPGHPTPLPDISVYRRVRLEEQPNEQPEGSRIDVIYKSTASIRHGMETTREDVTSQVCCLEDLVVLASSRQGSSICQDGCIQEVVYSMQRHINAKKIQDLGCRTLEALVWNHDSVILAEIQRTGGMERILCAMETHPDNLSIQKKGCQAIAALAFYDQGRKDDIAAGNGVPILVNCLRMHQNVSEIVNGCCKALARLSYNNVENQGQVHDSGGISVVLDAMRLHREHSTVQRWCCYALAILASNCHVLSQNEIISRGGICSVLDAVKWHQKDATILKSCCDVLIMLAMKSAVNQSHIGEEGGIEVVLKGAKDHIGQSPQQWCFEALASVASESTSNQERIAVGEGPALVLEGMRRHSEDSDVQYWGCEVLALVSPRNSFRGDARMTAKAISTILNAMKKHCFVVEVQNSACKALTSFENTVPSNRKLIVEKGGVDALHAVVRIHPKDSDTKSIAALLRKLSLKSAENKVMSHATLVECN